MSKVVHNLFGWIDWRETIPYRCMHTSIWCNRNIYGLFKDKITDCWFRLLCIMSYLGGLPWVWRQHISARNECDILTKSNQGVGLEWMGVNDTMALSIVSTVSFS